MAMFLIICAIIWLGGLALKGAFVLAGFVLKVTGLLLIGFTLYYLILACLGIPYH